MQHIILLAVIVTLFSCGQNDTKQKELELKERELALKEKELALMEKDTIKGVKSISKSDESMQKDTDVTKNPKTPKDITNSETLIKNTSDINLEGIWTQCDEMNPYGFKLIKKGEGYYTQKIKGYFLPFDCFLKKTGELQFSAPSGDVEITYDKLKKRLHTWTGAGDDTDFCKKD